MIYVGIDLGWNKTSPSPISFFKEKGEKLLHLETTFQTTPQEIVTEILKYNSPILIGIDAPLKVTNETGNREIEKSFIKDFAKYKISMLPVNRNLLLKMFDCLKGEEILELLLKNGFNFGFEKDKSVIEVYPHSTIATVFNNNKILPYKRKKGRDVAFIKEQLKIYQNYLKKVIESDLLKTDVATLKGKDLKSYEDILDSFTCAYTLHHCRTNNNYKIYTELDGGVFITPMPKEI